MGFKAPIIFCARTFFIFQIAWLILKLWPDSIWLLAFFFKTRFLGYYNIFLEKINLKKNKALRYSLYRGNDTSSLFCHVTLKNKITTCQRKQSKKCKPKVTGDKKKSLFLFVDKINKTKNKSGHFLLNVKVTNKVFSLTIFTIY